MLLEEPVKSGDTGKSCLDSNLAGIKKHTNELSKLLDSMFPKDKNDKEKS